MQKEVIKLSDYAIVRKANKIAENLGATFVFADISSISKIQRLRVVMRNSIGHLQDHPNSIVGDMINGYTMYGDIWYRWHHNHEE